MTVWQHARLMNRSRARSLRCIVFFQVAVLMTAGLGEAARAGEDPRVSHVGAVSAASLLPACDEKVTLRGSEVEPALAVHPSATDKLVIAYQQDRTKTVGSIGAVASATVDGGDRWIQTIPALSACGTAFDRVGATSVTTGPDGTTYLAGLAHSSDTKKDPPNYPLNTAITMSVSRDSGRSWSAPAHVSAVEYESEPAVQAHPTRPSTAYLVWSRHNTKVSGDSVVTFATTTDHGRSWALTEIPVPPVVLSGALLDPAAATPALYPAGILPLKDNSLMVIMTAATPEDFVNQIAPGRWPVLAIQSQTTRTGVPIEWGDWKTITTIDARFPRETMWSPNNGGTALTTVPLASAEVGQDGSVYVVWPDRVVSNDVRLGHPGLDHQVRLMRRSPQGIWGEPVVVASHRQPVFLSQVATTADGIVGVAYHHLDADVEDDDGQVQATVELAYSAAGGAPGSWNRVTLRGPFDLKKGVTTPKLFTGNSMGFAGTPTGFVAALALPNEEDTAHSRGVTDIHVVRFDAARAGQ